MDTVYDFLNLCTQDWIDIDLFDCDTEESTTINIADMNDLDQDILYAEVMSWDVDNGKVCINYSKE